MSASIGIALEAVAAAAALAIVLAPWLLRLRRRRAERDYYRAHAGWRQVAVGMVQTMEKRR